MAVLVIPEDIDFTRKSLGFFPFRAALLPVSATIRRHHSTLLKHMISLYLPVLMKLELPGGRLTKRRSPRKGNAVVQMTS
jgi:hypothetical protein